MCQEKNKEKEMLEGAAVLAGGAKENLPEEGASEQRLEGGEEIEVLGTPESRESAFLEREQKAQRSWEVPGMLAD